MKRKFKVIIDDRESKRIKLFLLSAPNFNFKIYVKRLDVGDLIFTNTKESKIGTTVIEIKEINDFVRSISDHSVFIQAKNMKENFDNSIIMTYNSYYSIKSSININSVNGAIASLFSKYGCSIIHTRDINSLVYTSLSILKKATEDVKLKSPMKKLRVSKEEREIAMLSCIEGIGRSVAISLLENYTIGELALIDDWKVLTNIYGVGKSKAKSVVNMFGNNNNKKQDYVTKIRKLHDYIDKQNKKIEKLKEKIK